jgi:hypothetical protein
MPGFLDLITAAETRWDAAALLLATWHARPAGTRPRRGDDGFLALVDEVRSHFDAKPDTLQIDDVDRGQILAWTEAGAELARVDAVGFGLSFSASAGFAQSWRERVGEGPFRPAVGDVFPAADAPWPPALGGARRTPSSRSMNIDDDDHPYARVFREDMLAVEFDFGLWPALRRIGLRLDAVAAITVDEDLDALGLDAPRASAYPIRPSDEDARAERVLERLNAAIHAGAEIVLLPELSTTPAIVERIAARLDDDEEQRLVICGSWHAADPDDGRPANLSVGLVSGLRARMRHRKLVEFGDLYPRDPDDRRREGIAVPDPPPAGAGLRRRPVPVRARHLQGLPGCARHADAGPGRRQRAARPGAVADDPAVQGPCARACERCPGGVGGRQRPAGVGGRGRGAHGARRAALRARRRRRGDGRRRAVAAAVLVAVGRGRRALAPGLGDRYLTTCLTTSRPRVP